MKKITFCVFLLILLNTIAFCQPRISITGIDILKKKSNLFGSLISNQNSTSTSVVNNIPRYCVDFFTNNKKFIAIDRQNLTLINLEKNLQKSEDFIDGYIVEQGRAEGVDYILKSFYYEETKSINIRIYNVADGTIKCSEDVNLETNILGFKSLDKQIRYMLHNLMYNCFNTKFSVMRPLPETDAKCKNMLVAIGKKSKIEVEDKVEYFILEEETVDDVKIERKKVISTGIIWKIQDDNFSEVKTDTGTKELAAAYAAGKKIYAVILNKFL